MPDLVSNDLVAALSHLCQLYGIEGKIPVATDGSWVGHQQASSSNSVGYLLELAQALSSLGMDITIILDGKG